MLLHQSEVHSLPWYRLLLSSATGNLAHTGNDGLSQKEAVCTPLRIHLAFPLKKKVFDAFFKRDVISYVFNLKLISCSEVPSGSLSIEIQGNEQCLAAERNASFFLTSFMKWV